MVFPPNYITEQTKKFPKSKKYWKKFGINAGKFAGNVAFGAANAYLLSEPGLGYIAQPFMKSLQTDMNNGNIKSTKYLAKHPSKYAQKVAQNAALGQLRNIPGVGLIADNVYESTIHGNANRLKDNVGKRILSNTLDQQLEKYGVPGSAAISDRVSNSIIHGNVKKLIEHPYKLAESMASSMITPRTSQMTQEKEL